MAILFYHENYIFLPKTFMNRKFNFINIETIIEEVPSYQDFLYGICYLRFMV
jgi:hypothetical protein